MRIWPWDFVPNTGAYYGKLLRQAVSDFLAYLWAQIVTGAVLAPVSALLARHYHWIPDNGVVWTIAVSLVPYVILSLIVLVVNIFRAPVKMDNARAEEYGIIKGSMGALDQTTQATIQAQAARSQRLKRSHHAPMPNSITTIY